MVSQYRVARGAFIGLFLLGTLSGCQGWNKTQTGAALGSLVGAGTGAIIGHQTGNKAAGALIGAGAGAIGGGLLGNAADKADERDAAIAHARMTQQQAQAEARAMTNRNVVDFTKRGYSDELIISTMRDRGGNFDTSPEGINFLKQMGVSDRVVMAMQGYDRPRY